MDQDHSPKAGVCVCVFPFSFTFFLGRLVSSGVDKQYLKGVCVRGWGEKGGRSLFM